ncbi:IclR family transcriptional regulator [Haloarcula salina]|uniref:IclR family transcriptional regulator n=1 Tax=Haloarcula salina TaxID=1429914 RepID=A0AA41G4P0_9EURY|nr:IclR family transcriptional regulator [Haloarcula salina]MBV0903541.1 IclR family transcriptional regulator [Haloarcula salina]
MVHTAKNPIRSDLTLLAILEGVERLGGGTIREVADETGITKSTVHNHLSTLRQEGYVIKKGDSYQLGLRFLTLGEAARNQGPLFAFGRPEADRICTETGELTNLSTIENGRGVYLYRTKDEPEVRFSTDAGEYHDLHCSATGKAMLAFLPDRVLDDVIETHGLTEHTPNTITSRDALEDELETVREEQLALDLEEYEKGLRCIASPILDENDETLGAISLSGPAMKFTGEYYHEELAEAVKSAANVISLNITRTDESTY